MPRTAEIARQTKETDIKVSINLDGKGENNIDTGIGFFDHMLTALSKHSGIDMNISCKGDLQVDAHHSVEDVGIVLGKAFNEAIGDKAGIRRYGSASIHRGFVEGIDYEVKIAKKDCPTEGFVL